MSVTNSWIEIFKAGKQTDSQGREKDFTAADLDKIVSSYNPANHEAPVVIGHPQENAPAWGWVEGLKREGQVLLAKFKDLVPEFVDLVKQGMFKKRSISLYPDLSLRHVGFLGAVPPAVKGLADIQFNADEANEYEFNDQSIMAEKWNCLPSRSVCNSILCLSPPFHKPFFIVCRPTFSAKTLPSRHSHWPGVLRSSL